MPLSRRDLLAGAGALSAGASLPGTARAAGNLHLRILETSDLHMFALDWDYYHAKPDPTVGLDKVATLIAEARASSPNTLLFDNGDILQGNPLGDYMAIDGHLPPGAAHPMFRAMNLLRYDAAPLGNHEFNYGLPFLDRALAGADFPFVCANLSRADGEPYLPPFRVLERAFVDGDGAPQTLRIGVIGFVPPQIMTWDRSNLEGRVRCGGILDAARQYVPGLRAQCDVLIALSHSGISVGKPGANEENASFHLASVPGIDAILTGHSHRVFPGPDYAGRAGVDAGRGTLNGVPAVMPGFWGSHLGVIDLELAREGARWSVANFAVEARPIYRREGGKTISLAAPDARVKAAVAVEDTAVNAWVAEPIGRFAAPAHSYFVFAGYDPCSAIVNAAQAWYAKPLLTGTQHEGLPVLSASAPFKAGYTPDWFIDIPAGAVAIRDIADLYIYPNTIAAVRVTGAAVREWLEHAARVFNRIQPGPAAPQALVDARVPSFNFDVIAGVTYQIDVSAPARYDQKGQLANASARRIADLRYDGAPIDDTLEFIVVTNNYRADGGGNFPGLDGKSVVLRAPDSNRDAIIKYVRGLGEVPAPLPSPWTFAALGRRATVAFDSGSNSAARLADVPGLRPASGEKPGFERWVFDLG